MEENNNDKGLKAKTTKNKNVNLVHTDHHGCLAYLVGVSE